MCGNTFVAEVGKPRLVALPEVLAMLERAHGEVSRICRERWDGKHGWKTTIPATDSDILILIGHALSAAGAFLQRGLTVARDAPSEEERAAALFAYDAALAEKYDRSGLTREDRVMAMDAALRAYLAASRQAEPTL